MEWKNCGRQVSFLEASSFSRKANGKKKVSLVDWSLEVDIEKKRYA
jgi:hypothetical protein